MKTDTIWNEEKIAQIKNTRNVDKVYVCRLNGSDALGYFVGGDFFLAKDSILSPEFDRQTDEDYGEEDYSQELHFRTEMSDVGYFKYNRATRDEGCWTPLEMARIVSGKRLPDGDWWVEV